MRARDFITEYRQGVAEAGDSNFVGFMNKAMGTRQDKASVKLDPNTVMSMNNMPGYKKAFEFGMDVIKKIDPDTKQEFADAPDDTFFSYMVGIATRKGLIPKHFYPEDLDEVTGEFEEIFNDPDMEGWSWTDLLRDNIGMAPRAFNKADVQAHKAQMAKAQQKKAAGPEPIDAKKLDVVKPTRSDTYEIWYPQGEFYGTATWGVVEKGFKDQASAQGRIAQLQKDPDAVKIIQAGIKKNDPNDRDQDVAEGQKR
jgi:hypothetical protein